jgi:hypothetical protein
MGTKACRKLGPYRRAVVTKACKRSNQKALHFEESTQRRSKSLQSRKRSVICGVPLKAGKEGLVDSKADSLQWICFPFALAFQTLEKNRREATKPNLPDT